jgi:hypothetical protein
VAVTTIIAGCHFMIVLSTIATSLERETHYWNGFTFDRNAFRVCLHDMLHDLGLPHNTFASFLPAYPFKTMYFVI